MRLPVRCIIHVAVSDGSKINRPDRTLSNRAFTVLSRSPSLQSIPENVTLSWYLIRNR